MTEMMENVLPEVKEQYEELPYPERKPKDEKKRMWLPISARLDAINHFCFKGKSNFENFRVLIAGGGTGDACIAWAEQLVDKKGSSVVYLDMSTASMNIAKERAKIRKLDNIEWLNDSLLNLPDMDLGQFDFIDCTGVLHHLEDPDAGLNALKSALKPDGSMYVMVYAQYGRHGVYMVQDLMKLVNKPDTNKTEKIKNTKTLLGQLPPHHWVNISKKTGLLAYKDEETEAGIYDLFLHSQDRAYTILEVHDWLERCNLKMIGEPTGKAYIQREYLPELFIQDEKLLEQIKTYPIKVQQAIGELMTGKMGTHQFYITHDNREPTEADINDIDEMIVCRGVGITINIDFEQAAAAIRQHGGGKCTLDFDSLPGKPRMMVPEGKYVSSILRQIDGKRTIRGVLEAVKNSPKYKDAEIDEKQLFDDFKELFLWLKRGHITFLRHKSVKPFKNISEMQQRVADIYK